MYWLWILVAAVVVNYACYGAFLFIRAKRTTTAHWSIPTHVAIASFISSSLLNFVLLIIAVRSLQTSVTALDAANSTSEQQQSANTQQLQALEAARQAILTTSAQQQTLLSNAGNALETEVRTSRQQADATHRMLDAAHQQQALLTSQLEMMKSQTAVLQKQWERQNQQPSLMVLVGTNVLQPDSELFLDIAKPKTPRLLLALSMRNVGSAVLRRPQVHPDVEPPAGLECLVYRGSMLNIENPCPVPTPQLPDIVPDTDQSTNHQHMSKTSDLNLYVSFIVPTNTNEFTVHYVISADNLSAAVYSLHVTLRG